jgi:hypothetical protein
MRLDSPNERKGVFGFNVQPWYGVIRRRLIIIIQVKRQPSKLSGVFLQGLASQEASAQPEHFQIKARSLQGSNSGGYHVPARQIQYRRS